MTTEPHSAFDDVIDSHSIDAKTQSKADYGVSAERKIMLSNTTVPLHVLAAHGIEIPHREYIDSPDDAIQRNTTVRCESSDGETVRVHLHQDVREDMDDSFGDFGAVDTDDTDVVWTVVNLDNGTVTMKVVGEWQRKREVDYETFADNYEPIYVTDSAVDHPVPQFGY